MAKRLGFEKMLLKNESLRCIFISNEKSIFYESDRFQRILDYIQQHPSRCRLKQTPKYLMLTFERVINMDQAKFLLQQVADFVLSVSPATEE
jgi:transcription-repair coupling factor (superfamily II helicase)